MRGHGQTGYQGSLGEGGDGRAGGASALSTGRFPDCSFATMGVGKQALCGCSINLRKLASRVILRHKHSTWHNSSFI